ncbi:hypothetical protein ACFV84_05165 [Kitasatospora sp. NPDC059811]|uniref:hypothetical protein n=1 Tax=Streptomycetaceae TaxID=2062 RepID=UPI0007AFAE72|nr:hypothetical protein [Streptomyces sp. MJM8645]
MKLRFVGKDPESGDHGCPSVWVDEERAELVIQGWKADEATEVECLKAGPIPEHETVIRLPRRMIPLLREALGDTDAL